MDIKTTKTIDMLTKNSVSIITNKTITVDGVKSALGEPHRCAYCNTAFGRADITANEPAEVVAAVMAMWGDTPTEVNNNAV